MTFPKDMQSDSIYIEEFKKSIQSQKRFREIWMEFDAPWNHELFQYANDDFYFYRFNVERKERGTNNLLRTIIFRLLNLYNLAWSKCYEPLWFKCCFSDGSITGVTFEDFYEDDNITQICKDSGVDKICVIRTWKGKRTEEWIAIENKQYQSHGIPIRAISLSELFADLFGEEEYRKFELHLANYLEQVYDLVGYRSIKFLSSMNLAMQKLVIEKKLIEYANNRMQYSIIDRTKDAVQGFLYLDGYRFPTSIEQQIQSNFVGSGIYKALIGSAEFAESFVTSEWLFHSLKGTSHFDYTSIVSGYLKSVEQLLLQVVLVNTGNNCKITLKDNKKIDAINAGLDRYTKDKGRFRPIVGDRTFKWEYIDLIDSQLDYMDSDLGTFEHFLRNNPHIFYCQLQQQSLNNAKTYCSIITDLVSCFRAECRNGYFHTHNLKNWTTVERIRSNAFMIYVLLLGSCDIPNSKYAELKMPHHDWFDALCVQIQNNRRVSPDYIFEYADGRSDCCVFDTLNNAKEYTDSGIEHYERLLFLRVPDFSIESYEALDAGINDEIKVYLTRTSIPTRIWCINRKKQKILIYDATNQ